MSRSASSTLGRIGSGLIPPKYGFRSWWISWIRIVRPPSSRGIHPDPSPVQRVDEHGDIGGPQGVEVDRPPDEPFVSLERVEPLDQACRLGVVERASVDRHAAVDGEPSLDRR